MKKSKEDKLLMLEGDVEAAEDALEGETEELVRAARFVAVAAIEVDTAKAKLEAYIKETGHDPERADADGAEPDEKVGGTKRAKRVSKVPEEIEAE